MRKVFRGAVVVALLVSTGSAIWLASAVAQEAPAPNAEARLGDDEAGRLPPGYTVVVTKVQRAKIYEIQDSYQQQLDNLQKQIAEIESKRDAEIAALLNAEQKQILGYVLKLRESERKQESGSN